MIEQRFLINRRADIFYPKILHLKEGLILWTKIQVSSDGTKVPVLFEIAANKRSPLGNYEVNCNYVFVEPGSVMMLGRRCERTDEMYNTEYCTWPTVEEYNDYLKIRNGI